MRPAQGGLPSMIPTPGTKCKRESVSSRKIKAAGPCARSPPKSDYPPVQCMPCWLPPNCSPTESGRFWAASQPAGECAGAVCGRENGHSGAPPNPTGAPAEGTQTRRLDQRIRPSWHANVGGRPGDCHRQTSRPCARPADHGGLFEFHGRRREVLPRKCPSRRARQPQHP
jgi:hypothetical protein